MILLDAGGPIPDEVRDEVERIGRERWPFEACGVVVPEPGGLPHQVVEVPNISDDPERSAEFCMDDVRKVLLGWDPEYLEWQLTDCWLWHTHPGGNIGPSADDLRGMPSGMYGLVVTCAPDQAAVAVGFWGRRKHGVGVRRHRAKAPDSAAQGT